MPSQSHRGLTEWFVRRAGVARTTTFLCATGLAWAAITGARPVVAAAGLAIALCGGLTGLMWTAASRVPGRRAHFVLVVSIILVGFFAGYLAGSVRMMALLDGELKEHVGERVVAELVVTGPVRSSGGWQSALAEMRAGTFAAAGGSAAGEAPAGTADGPQVATGDTVLLEVASARGSAGGLSGGSAPLLSEGAILNCEGTITEPEGPTDSGFDQRSYLRRQGVEMVFSAAARDVVVQGSRGGFWGLFDRIRVHARTELSRGPAASLDEVLKGVVMGDTAGIEASWLDAFRRSGTAHMFSVSGLHVASLAAIMLGLARLCRLSRGVGYLLAALAAALMIPFAGASPPVTRAVAMILVVLAGRWVGRGRDQWQVLGLAACVVLALNPLGLFDVGFQLSFGAFGGMLALSARLQRRLQRLPAGVASNLAVSMAASLGTAPVSLLVFGQTSLVGALANVLVIPVLPVITGLGMAAVLGGRVWSGLSSVLDWMVAPATAWTVEVSRLFAVAPVLRMEDLGRALGATAAGLLVLPLALALAGRVIRPPCRAPLPWFRRSLRWVYGRRPKRHGLGVAAGVMVVISALIVGMSVYAPLSHAFQSASVAWAARGWPERVEVRVLDVGQGNAVLVRTPGRHALLFDGGPAGCELGRQLTALGVRRLDVVVISHPHADHFAGLLECVDEIEVGTLVDQTQLVEEAGEMTVSEQGTGAREAQDYLALRRRVAERGADYLLARGGSSVEVDGVRVGFFASPRPLAMLDGADPWGSRASPPGGEELNAGSLVALLCYGEAEFLLPGDAEAGVLEQFDLPPADVLVVPHHGSRGACSAGLLRELGLKAAAVSVGEHNSFGHPDATILALLEQEVGSLARTDRAGWVCYTSDGKELVLTTERKGAW